MSTRDLYAILGLKRGVGRAEVERAGSKLLRLNHPSLNPDDAVAEERYREVLRAYEVLRDAARKKAYDRSGVVPGKAEVEPPRPKPAEKVPRDVYVTVSLSFREAILGARRQVTYAGDGGEALATVDLPPGMDAGAEMRLPRPDGKVGDLVVVTNVASHPYFRRMGNNLYADLPVTVTEAALGARVEAPTVDGMATVKVPPGTQSGQRLRLRERGVPSRYGGGRGDLYLEVRVVTPAARDVRVRQALRELHRALSDLEEPPRAGLRRYAEGADEP